MGPLEIKGIILGLGVLAGALCLFLGYRLYDKGVIEKGHAEAEGHGVKVTLKDYGPGVIFALFGAAIIVFCITRPLSDDVKTTTYTSQGGAAPASSSEALGAPSDQPGAAPLAPVSVNPAPSSQSKAQGAKLGPAPKPASPKPPSNETVTIQEKKMEAYVPPDVDEHGCLKSPPYTCPS